mgnify:CR=1 FL=1
MAEECDRIEGFIYLTDGFDGFAGVTDKISQFNSDEYNRKSVMMSFDEPWSRVTPYRYFLSARFFLIFLF